MEGRGRQRREVAGGDEPPRIHLADRDAPGESGKGPRGVDDRGSPEIESGEAFRDAVVVQLSDDHEVDFRQIELGQVRLVAAVGGPEMPFDHERRCRPVVEYLFQRANDRSLADDNRFSR